MIRHKISSCFGLLVFYALTVVGIGAAKGETLPLNGKKTLAITYFANNSKLDKYDSLSKGIADMLITDLSNVDSLQIVEREQLEKLLGELKLNQSAFIDPATAQKLGKGLGAEYILTGAIASIEPTIRIDARIIGVTTAKIIKSEYVTGDNSTFFELEKELADKLIRGLEVKLTQPEQVKVHCVATKSFQAVVHYSNAIDAKDKGDTEKAIVELKKAVAQDNNFSVAATRLKEMVQTMERYKEINTQAEKDIIAKANKKIDSGTISWDDVVPVSGIYQTHNQSKEALEFYDRVIYMKRGILSYILNRDYDRTREWTFPSAMAIAQGAGNAERLFKYAEDYLKSYPKGIYASAAQANMEYAVKMKQEKK